MRLIRILDIVGSLIGLIITAPIMLGAAMAIWLESGSPVIFVQNRVGKENKPFRIYKFRTMSTGTPEVAKDKLASQMASRVTKAGRVLRRTSIDELPQLWNILIGDMSLVGPRPALYNQYDLIEMRTQAGVHRLRPGLTGLAQIMGREDMSLEQKVRYDQELCETLNPVRYMLIVLRTFGVLFGARGTY